MIYYLPYTLEKTNYIVKKYTTHLWCDVVFCGLGHFLAPVLPWLQWQWIIMFKACSIKMERTGNSEQDREHRNTGPSLLVGSLCWKPVGKLHIRDCRSTVTSVYLSFWCFSTFSQHRVLNFTVFPHHTCTKMSLLCEGSMLEQIPADVFNI